MPAPVRARVAGQLRVDRGVAGPAGRGQPVHSAQRRSVSTTRPGTPAAAVEQPGQQVQLVSVRRWPPGQQRVQASWWSLPGSAGGSSSSARGQLAACPSAPTPDRRRKAMAAQRFVCRLCSTETERLRPMPLGHHAARRPGTDNSACAAMSIDRAPCRSSAPASRRTRRPTRSAWPASARRTDRSRSPGRRR